MLIMNAAPFVVTNDEEKGEFFKKTSRVNGFIYHFIVTDGEEKRKLLKLEENL